ncbi:conserved hypothetical protein [Thermotomaculum hydrothermale]|uniref:Paraquat-inducible protein A n=1 Tax=Thermotomaculum hydrothermale TaxID=981385 RepID=A0A7R6PFI3_9BACT|nr:paraquat-inducible protein A [Thermotomaculum hydrothermale]BBB32794.1 conserved hypothetical protein [Thermotomaculum hydrothermale]
MAIKRECNYCGTTVEIEKLSRDTDYLCPVCKSLVYRRGQPFQHVFFLSITSLLLFFWMLNAPLLSVKILNIERTITFANGIGYLIETEYYLTALILSLTVIVIPYAMLILRIAVMVSVRLKALSPATFKMLNFYKVLHEWNMAEVYLVGILIAIIKLRSLAEVTVGNGTLIFLLFIVTFYISVEWFNPNDVYLFCGDFHCKNREELLFYREVEDET